MTLQHQTVLLEEAVAALMVTTCDRDSERNFVDATFGRGGHSARILAAMTDKDTLVAFDKDPEAARVAQAIVSTDQRFRFIHGSFAQLDQMETSLTGILFDLGVSSPQIDDDQRGFSFLKDGPLDMRMDNTSGVTAADFVNTASESMLCQVFRDYGEERFARRIARALVAARADTPLTTTGQLATLVSAANPSWEKHKHPATRVFQAIRIHINKELDDLERALAQAVDLLVSGGRLVVISFHSLEDRIVKRFMRDAARGQAVPRGIPVVDEDSGRSLRLIGKALRPSEAEIAANPRSRSAIMRVAEKL